MHNEFWQIAFMYRWVTANQLKLAVKTETNPFGEISKEQFKEITRQEFNMQAELSVILLSKIPKNFFYSLSFNQNVKLSLLYILI